ncbi:hypothetical protein HELRODRAFT_163153 [Helobdella robusta]|uniref:Uncharacterized protein n=1 Tax=Helobdella robusta TaxID=6412 RepID=T1ETQ6_HELRO|nr:hypothetical protein HELRODRAFT_163153 [Helobdella robusta]ESN96123.1 hypothetical protein HELRODRAFT_163153 [Helobdella robusta]
MVKMVKLLGHAGAVTGLERIDIPYCHTHCNLVNVALKKPAYLSSLYQNLFNDCFQCLGINGVNGIKTDIVHADNSFQYSNWFVVDRLDAYQWPLEVTIAGQVLTVNCKDGNKFSRYVIIQQSQVVEEQLNNKFLAFAELEVYADENFLQYDNLAYKRPAYMSTPDATYIPNNCVDEIENNFCLLGAELAPNPNWPGSSKFTDRMTQFIVGLAASFNEKVKTVSVRSSYDVCGQGPSTVQPVDTPIRLDCPNKNAYSRYVIVQQDPTIANNIGGMTFADLTVYGSENSVNKYMGCFQNFQVQKSFQESSLDICISLYNQLNIPYATVKDNQMCYCGTPTTLFPSSQCFSNCDVITGLCAASDLTAVYTTPISPGYLGCYVDDANNRDLDVLMKNDVTSMTSELCINLCVQNGYAYAGLQNGMASANECNSECSGNQAQLCGGPLRNTIYSLCNTYGGLKKCPDQYHCSDGFNFDTWMNCQSQKCLAGWTGSYCKDRDCQTKNGNCGIHPCSTFKIGTATLTECVCKVGYQKTYYNDDCTLSKCSVPNVCDVAPAICNLTTSTCTNTPDSYVCTCLTGFRNPTNNKTICLDIDECVEKSDTCNKPSEACVNTIGSFTCQCSAGYQRINNICTDIDECSNSSSPCNNATSSCMNNPGTYNCTCLSGFCNKDQFTCEDVDECSRNASICNSAISLCLNVVGSYICSCYSGYSNKDQFTCEVSPERIGLYALIGVTVAGLLTLLGLLLFLAAVVNRILKMVFRKRSNKNNKPPNGDVTIVNVDLR